MSIQQKTQTYTIRQNALPWAPSPPWAWPEPSSAAPWPQAKDLRQVKEGT
jgi:hypothetical protein